MRRTQGERSKAQALQHDPWEQVWASLSSAGEETVDLPFRRAKPGTSLYHLSLEGILNMVTQPGERKEKRGRETLRVRRLHRGGDAVNLCIPEHTTPETAEEAAQAVRVLQKIAAQYADAKRKGSRKRKGLWLTPEEVEVWNGLLRQQPVLQFNCYNPETHEREAYPGRENQVAGGGWPRSDSLFHSTLYLAAQFLAEVVYEHCNERVARCLAPLHPADTKSRKICGRLFVTTTQGGLGQTCSDTCRQRVKDRKRAVRDEATRTARKEGFEELRQLRRAESQKAKG